MIASSLFSGTMLLLLAAPPVPLQPTSAVVPAGEPWEAVNSDPDCQVFSRSRAGSDVQEVYAVGELKVAAADLHALLNDLDAWESFFPFVDVSRVLKRGKHHLVAYQRSSMPFVSDRDYIVRIDRSLVAGPHPGDPPRHLYSRWTRVTSKDAPAAQRGVVRVTELSGGWDLEPLSAERTRVHFYLFIDPGGSVPSLLVNFANRQGMPTIFGAIERVAKRRAHAQRHARRKPSSARASASSTSVHQKHKAIP